MHQPKLLIVPGACDALGGTLVTLSLLIKGFFDQDRADSIKVLVSAGSVMESYLLAAGQEAALEIVPARDKSDYLHHALACVAKYPLDWPLLLDNCVERSLLSVLILAAPKLRLSGRPIYHFCHDLALSYNVLGNLSRKLAFGLLRPKALCNSNFTKDYIIKFLPDVAGVLYQPVDLDRFRPYSASQAGEPPAALKLILNSGARIMLTPSRINQAGIVNDKNLRGLIPVLAALKQQGGFYHGVVIGEDRSPSQSHSKALMAQAERFGVADCFTILPPTFEISAFYNWADVVISLAPREPFGRVVVEAIACGTPFIGSSTGGIGEILSQAAPEWQVDSNCPEAIAQTILKTAVDPQTKIILQTARSWVEEHCSLARYAQDMMKLTGVGDLKES
jgi:glycosyltransferase involved in cell wall biosynthesis